jgi:Aminoglycoside-2''-adenylyltransferase
MTMTPDIDAWDSWAPSVVASRLAGVGVPWYVAGGWAVDLHLGGQRREHGDLEIAVPAAHFDAIAARFPELAFHVAGDGEVVPINPVAMAEHFQTWGWDAAAAREKDEGDYAALAPGLSASERAWLDEALDIVHPGAHAWHS